MGHEKDKVGEETAVEPAENNLDRVKLSQGLLSFRSRKLLRNSLSKTISTNNVVKPAPVFPSTESNHLERSIDSHSKVHHGEPTKACRKLWDSTTTENDSANSGTRSCSHQSHKLPAIQPAEVQQVDERSAPRTTENDSANARSRPSSRHSKKLQGSVPVEDQQVDEGSVKGEGVVVAPLINQLSPKFKLLDKFYESLEAACSLLRIRRQMCTFRSVCKIVESMSKRRFLLKHLAQIKHIFPEVLQLEYVRCQDPDNLGERWDLRVTLLPLSSDSPLTSSPLKGSAGQTVQTVRRRKEFHSRLVRFESSHPEDGDIPLEPLPRRPFGSHSANWQPAVSPSSDRTSDSCLSTPGGVSEGSTHPPEAKPPIQISTEDFEFSIVKPSRVNDTAELAGISHFPSSFRPFYSGIQPADVSHVAALPSPKVAQSRGTLPLESHFPASFRPAFSARPKQPPNRVLSDKPPCLGSRCEDKHEENGYINKEIGVESQLGDKNERECVESRVCDKEEEICVESRVCEKEEEICVESRVDDKHKEIRVESRVGSGDPVVSSGSFSIYSSSLSENSSHFSPSTPVPSSYSKELQQGRTDKGSPALHADDFSFSPAPTHTPPFVSPMNRIFSPDQKSLKEEPCKSNSSNSFRDPLPPKSQGIMRSLRFASPARSSPVVTAENSHTPQTIVNSAVNTPPSSSRLEQALVHTPSPLKNLPPRAPETPSLQTPGRVSESKEVWYSPPKRTKLNRASLFTNDKDKHEGTVISHSKIAGAAESSPEASSARAERGSDFCNGPQQENSMSVKSHPTLKEKEGVSESDLDVIQCLPQDLVQSVREKERKMKDDSSRELAQLKRRQQMMGGVPKLFNQLRLIFQSLNRSVLPESELIRTILTSHPEITDKGEVEERLKLVIELAPDYINTRPSHSGELLYRVDKRADVVQIQRRLSGGPSKKLF